MCRNIRTLFHFDPPVTEEEIRAATLQYVRKISGMNRPSAANAEAFDRAWGSADLVGGRTAFAERRTPQFRGE